MRKEVINKLYELMKQDERIWLLTADLGYGLMDEIRDKIPQRFLNTSASEQACSDICVGLALSGKIPVMYSITPFLLFRCFETWHLYANEEKIKVILLGSGRDKDYHIDGPSHDASDDWKLFAPFEQENDAPAMLNNFDAYWPKDNEQAKKHLELALEDDKPAYINLMR